MTQTSTEGSPSAMSCQTVKQWRRDQRAHLLKQRVAAGGKQRKLWNAAIQEVLGPLLRARGHETVALYWPFKGEFDCRALMRTLYAHGTPLALPAVVAPRVPLEFRRWHPGMDMVPGVYKIPVPKARDIVVPEVVVAPLVGFDAEGYRLGYGGGYYDRSLSCIAAEPLIIGVGYEMSRLETLYPQPHDVPMHRIVTEAGVYDFGARSPMS